MSALEDILRREFFGIKLGLDAMRALCRALDEPQRTSPCVLIAGTNGKGSVAAMTSTALRAAGWRVGRYTSPHLVSLRERFAVDEAAAADDELEASAAVVTDAEARLRATGAVAAPMTFFELATATAFEHFRRRRVDVAVYEVGMGGRLDATNVASPAAGAITTIAVDHAAHLGDSVARIAYEKAGIVRANTPLVVGRLPADARAVVQRVAGDAGATLVEAHAGVVLSAELDGAGHTRVRLATPRHDYGTVTLALRGRHQADNAVVAVRLLEVLADTTPLRAGAEAIATGLTDARWAGRLDLRRTAGGQSILLDAAHNPAGTEALVGYLREAGMAPLPVVFGVMRDKDVVPMLRTLAPAATRLVLTQASTSRARPAAELCTLAASAGLAVPALAIASPAQAVREALAHAACVCVTGSIVLVGDVIRALEGADGA
jgi:dihydrofolate synthase/folylpolyglutamate synthase